MKLKVNSNLPGACNPSNKPAMSILVRSQKKAIYYPFNFNFIILSMHRFIPDSIINFPGICAHADDGVLVR